MDEEPSQNKTAKQANLDNLSKEELINKCKSLITFLKKAKTAKDDAVAEFDKLKSDQAKIIRNLEEERNKAEQETETMQEIVANLTENKMALVTKNESIQRQLNVQLSEVEALNRLEDSFAEERENHLKEINKLKLMATKQQKVVEQMKEEREKMIQQIKNPAWEEERTQLLDTLESLEAQIGQIDVLKSKCKKLLIEKEDIAKELSEVKSRPSFGDEKKAMEIVHNELKSQKIVLEEKYKTCAHERDELKNRVSELGVSCEKLNSTEALVKQYENELQSANEIQSQMELKYETAVQNIKQLEDQLKEETEKFLSLSTSHEGIQSELERSLQTLNEYESVIQKLNNRHSNYKEEIEELNKKLSTMELSNKNNDEDLELKNICDQLRTENEKNSNQIEKLNKENDILKRFQDSVSIIFNSENKDFENEDLIIKIQDFKMHFSETSSKYEELKSSTLKLVSLVNHLFCLKDFVDPGFSDDLISNVNNSYENLELTINEFKNSDLQDLCNTCSLNIKHFCLKVDNFEELSEEEYSEDRLSKPFINLSNNLEKICSVLSRLFKFNLVPDLREIIEFAHVKSDELDAFVLKALNHRNQINVYKESFDKCKEKIANQESVIEDNNQIILTFESDLKTLKDDYNEIQKLKMFQEEAMRDITQKYEDTKDTLEKEEQKYKEENDRNIELQNMLKDYDGLKETCEKLREEVQALQGQITNTANLSTTESEILSVTLEKTSEEKDLLQERVMALENDVAERWKLNESLTQEVDEMKAELESAKEEENQLKERLSSSDSSLNKLNESKESLNIQYEQLKTQIDTLLKDNDFLKERLLALENSYETVKAENVEKEQSLLSLQNQLTESSALKNTFDKSFKELMTKFDTLKAENEALRSQLTDLQLKLEDSVKLNEAINSDSSNMKSDYDSLKHENDSIKETMKSLETQLSESLSRNESIVAEFNRLKTENELLIGKLGTSENELTESLNRFESCNTEYENMKSEFAVLRTDRQTLEEKLMSLENEVSEMSERNEMSNNDCSVMIDMLTQQNKLKEGQCFESLKQCESLHKKLEETTYENVTLKETLSTFENNLQTSTANTIEELKTELETLGIENDKLNQSLAETLRCKELLKEEADKMQADNKLLNEDIESVREKLKVLQEEMIECVKCSESMKAESQLTKCEIENARMENANLVEKFGILENELMVSNKSIEDFNALVESSKEQVEQLRQEKEFLQNSVKTLEAKVIGCVKSYKAIHDESRSVNQEEEPKGEEEGGEAIDNDDKIEVENATQAATADASSRYTEIISELNEMNQIIRKRGEKISLLEDDLLQKDSEIKELSEQLEEAKGKLTSGEIELASKQELLQKIQSEGPPENVLSVEELQERITVLEEENSNLKKSIENENTARSQLGLCPADAQSEVMSTSTISKMEESHRMKEIEDTFEERYMKLKNLAIKLKKKLAEQVSEIKNLEESKKKLLLEKEEMSKNCHIMASKNGQILQSEIDRLQDSLDANCKELKEREKQLVSSAQEASDLKLKLVTLEEDNLIHDNERKNLEESLSCQKSLSESLQGQVIALEKRVLIEEENIMKLKEELSSLEDKVGEEKVLREHLLKELEEARQENKKHSLIDLEMKDYERSIEDLTTQVKEKEDCITDLTNRMSNEESRVASLNEEISLLKEQIENETDRAEKLKKTVSDYKNQLSLLRLDQEERMSGKEKDRETIESLNQEMEKQKLILSDLSSHASKAETKLRKEKEIAGNKVDLLEEKLDKSEKISENLSQELKTVRKEFEAYKIRAQTVLRQKSKVPQQTYEDLKSEKEQITLDLETSQIRAHQLQSELTAAKAEVGLLTNEKEKLTFQINNLSSEFSKKENALQEALSSWEKKFELKISEYQLIIANMSSQTEAMNNSFKSQLESIKERHLHEIQHLEAKIEECEDKIWHLKNTSSAANNNKMGLQQEGSLAPHHFRKASQGGVLVEEHRIDVVNMIREEGEGSEWVEPHPHRSPSQQLYNPPSLEQLINNPFPSQQPLYMDESMSVISATTEFSSKEVSKLESKLSSCESRLQQVTTLLTESEAENAKLVQLSDALKEEIRRASRNEKREKHLENNEYLKNVVLKFLSLKTGDEKFRLVPVLKTLLQLSPDEASNVAIIAKGDDAQNVPQGWGNYLHLWSGR